MVVAEKTESSVVAGHILQANPMPEERWRGNEGKAASNHDTTTVCSVPPGANVVLLHSASKFCVFFSVCVSLCDTIVPGTP